MTTATKTRLGFDPGRMTARVTIQHSTSTTRDAAGTVTQNWITFSGPVWAAIEPLTLREVQLAGQQQANLTHRVRMRHVSGVTPRMRLLYGARVLWIESVRTIDERRFQLELLCRETQ